MDTITDWTSKTFNQEEVDDQTINQLDQSNKMKSNLISNNKSSSISSQSEESSWLQATAAKTATNLITVDHSDDQNNQTSKIMELVVPFWLKKHHHQQQQHFFYDQNPKLQQSINDYHHHHHQLIKPSLIINNNSNNSNNKPINFSIDSILNGSEKNYLTNKFTMIANQDQQELFPNNRSRSSTRHHNHNSYNINIDNQQQQQQLSSLLRNKSDAEQFYKFFQHYTETGKLILQPDANVNDVATAIGHQLINRKSLIASDESKIRTATTTVSTPTTAAAATTTTTTIKRRPINRGPRIPFTPNQVLELESKFNKTQYLSSMEVNMLAKRLNLSDSRVRIWFQNRRAREKREHHHHQYHQQQQQHSNHQHQQQQKQKHHLDILEDNSGENIKTIQKKHKSLIFDQNNPDNHKSQQSSIVRSDRMNQANINVDDESEDASSMLCQIIMEEDDGEESLSFDPDSSSTLD